MLQPFKSEILQMQYPHAKRFAEDARRAFGADSTMAQVGAIWGSRYDMMFAGQGVAAEAFASHWASDEGKSTVQRFETKLLKWAKDFDG
jgi:hypothetical protein